MLDALIGRKVSMTRVFGDGGTSIPCTVLRVGPCVVVQKKEKGRDGYEAVQVGLVEAGKVRRVTKARQGHFDKAKVPPTRRLSEFRLAPGQESPAVGDKLLVSVFKPADRVDIVGTSKGKGFQGVMKRHHFAGGAASHGSMFHRAPGSVGASAYPSRTFRGQKMPGQMGNARVTVKNLQVVQVDEEHNLLVVRGAVPGAQGAYLTVRRSLAAPKSDPPPEKDGKAKKG